MRLWLSPRYTGPERRNGSSSPDYAGPERRCMNGRNGNGGEGMFRNPMLWLALVVQGTIVLGYAMDVRSDLDQALAEQANRRAQVYRIPEIERDVIRLQSDLARLDTYGTRATQELDSQRSAMEAHINAIDDRVGAIERRLGWRARTEDGNP
jgi:hypothetical protein